MNTRLMNFRGALVGLVILLAVGLLFHSQVSAIIWHATNGRDMTWDSHTITVPFSWRPVSNKQDVSLALAHATVSGAEEELVVTKKGQILGSPSAASTWQRDGVDTMNSRAPSSGQFEAYTVVTAAGDAFCIGSGKDDVAVSFECRVVGTDWDFRFLGNSQNALSARGIVASLR